MTNYEFNIFGNPVAQGRPKFFRRGNFVGAYDPGKSKTWKEDIKVQVLSQMKAGPVILEGPLMLQLVFRMTRPVSLPKKVIHHTKKPDIDNLQKAVKDALKGICYKDDSQIIEVTARKVYDSTPGVWIALREIED
jgi:Holliday junction resolvase RusA-like endonuclease